MRIVKTTVDFTSDGQPTPSKFNADISSTDSTHSYPPIDIRGRGTAGPAYAAGDFAGSGTLSGDFQWGEFPYPTNPKYATGTLRRVLRFDAATQLDTHYIDVSVFIHSIEFNYDKKKEAWVGSLAWVAAGNPTIVWGGTQVTISTPSPADASTYAGMTKTYDANGLATSATQRIFCEGITDSDAAEVTKIAALVATGAAPITNLKVLSCNLEQRVSSTGMFISIVWALQNSVDNQETPRNIIFTDPNDLNSEKTSATVYANASVPSTPSAPSGLKLVSYQDLKLNDQYKVRIYKWAKNDSKDEAEFPGTWTLSDPSSIASQASVALLDPDSIAPPVGFVSRGVREQFLTDDHRLLTLQAGLRTTADDIQMPGTWTWVDGSSLDGRGQKTTVYTTTDGVPSDPSPPSGLQIVESRIDQINNIVSSKTWIFGVNTNKQKIEFGGTVTAIDAQGLRDSADIVQVTTSATPPSTPAAPVGKIALGPITRQINPTHWEHSWKYADRNAKEDIEMGGTEAIRGFAAPFYNRIVTVTNNTSAADVIADAAMPAFFAEAYSSEIRVRKETSGKAVITKIYKGSIGLAGGGAYIVRGRATGTRVLSEFRLNSGTPQVYVAQKWALNGSWTRCILARRRVIFVARDIAVLRNFNASSVPDFPAQFDTLNNATFLGLSTAGVLYLGAEEDVKLNTGATTFPMDVAYQFKYTSLGHVKLDGWREIVDVNLASGSVSSGAWNNVSSLTGSGISVSDAYTQTDFNNFLP